MATFYIQLENKLLQISGDLTAENITKALGYVPVDSSTMNNYATKDEVSDLVDMSMVEELSQRVDNITFDSLKDNPFLQDGSGELNIVDESGNIIAKIDAEGIHSVDFIAGEHRLSDKTDKTYVDEAIKNVKVDLTGYATEEYVNNIDFYNINNNPIVNNGDGKLLFVDENGYIGLQLEEDGLYVKDVIADGHTLSQKADKSELSNYATKDEVSDLVDMSVVTELQGKVNTLIDTDADKSVRDIAVDVLTETLVSETATEAYDTLAEMSAWIKSHPEDASAMNEAIQKNATDIQSNTTAISNLDAAYKAADAKVLTDAQEYTDNINFYTIKNNPIVDNNDGNLTFVDESGNIGLQFSNNAILVNDVITPEHTLSSKADKSFVEDLTSFITNKIEKNEEVTSNSLNDLREIIGENEKVTAVALTNLREIINENEEVTSNAINDIKEKIDNGVNESIQVIWDANSNMNDFIDAGVYEIYGERTVKTDNLPILNEGSGHSFHARLTVLVSTLQPTNNEICITQFLMLSNRLGGEGNMYIRTYNENNSPSRNGWTLWQKLQGVKEGYVFTDTVQVNPDGGVQQIEGVTGLYNMVDNGLYTGIYTNDPTFQNPSFIETFVLIVINDYAVVGMDSRLTRQITQLKYANDAISKTSSIKKRTYIGNDDGYKNGKYTDWEDIGNNKNDIELLKGVIKENEKVTSVALNDVKLKYDELEIKVDENEEVFADALNVINLNYENLNSKIHEDETGELNITDENGNIGMKVSSEAVFAKEFISGEHKLSEKVNKTYVDNSIAQLVDGAPETLDTLNELSAALKDNADIVDVLNQSITSKQDKIDNLVIAEDVNEELDDVETNTYLKYVAQTLTEEQKTQARSNIGVDLTDYAKKSDLSNVATSGSYNDLTNKPTVLSESDINNLIDTKIGDINSILENIINGN